MDDKRMTYTKRNVNKRSQKRNGESAGQVLRFLRMKKDTRLTFRVRSDLKKALETIAAREGQSVARICEAFLLAGSDAYKKDGTRLLQRLIGRLSAKSLE
jgi:hypothetical protein